MALQIAKKELASLTKFQESIHVVTDPDKEEIISIFFRNFIKSTWYSCVPMVLKSSPDNDDTVYSVNGSFHFLTYTYLRFILPQITLKPEYSGKCRIAYPHNIGTNIIKRAVFKQDDDIYQKWDNIWADIYFQYYQESGPGKRKNHNMGIGNLKCLEEWTERLPSYPINVDQPWFYSADPSLAFPIFYKGSQCRAEHRYTFRKKISEILRIEVNTKSEGWVRASDPSRYINCSIAEIKTPELWGRYAYTNEREIGFYKCSPERSYYIRDVEACDTETPTRYGSSISIPIESNNPCLAMFWVAENSTATSNCNFSNYSTCTENLYDGWDPIRTTSFGYGTEMRFENMPSDHFNVAESRKHFKSSPCEPGYHGYSFAWDSTSFHGDTGITFNKDMSAKLSCLIENNNIMEKDVFGSETKKEISDADLVNKDEADSYRLPPKRPVKDVQEKKVNGDGKSPDFILHSRLLVMKKLTISKVEDGFKIKVE